MNAEFTEIVTEGSWEWDCGLLSPERRSDVEKCSWLLQRFAPFELRTPGEGNAF